MRRIYPGCTLPTLVINTQQLDWFRLVFAEAV